MDSQRSRDLSSPNASPALSARRSPRTSLLDFQSFSLDQSGQQSRRNTGIASPKKLPTTEEESKTDDGGSRYSPRRLSFGLRRNSFFVYIPKKKALLIGAIYKKPDQKEGELKGPHKDIRIMKELLMKSYGYEEANITILLDDGKEKEPTRANILQAMVELVKDARPGDKFVFHFSGHGTQVKRLKDDNAEEDGYDEAIVPIDSDHETRETLILDDQMNDILVKGLPIGCCLVAIYDSCHSGTALDVKHYDCNKVYIPYVSRGPRRAKPKHDQNVRRLAVDEKIFPYNVAGSPTGTIFSVNRKSKKKVKMTAIDVSKMKDERSPTMTVNHGTKAVKLEPITPVQEQTTTGQMPFRKLSLRIPSSASSGSGSGSVSGVECSSCNCHDVKSLKKTLTHMLSPIYTPILRFKAQQRRSPVPSSLQPPSKGCKCLCHIKLERSATVHSQAETSTIRPDPVPKNDQKSEGVIQDEPKHYESPRASGSRLDSGVSTPLILCTSPEMIYGCQSQPGSPVIEGGQAIQLAACLDSQSAFEGVDGTSMTKILIDILEKDPNPTYKDLMTLMHHRMLDAARRMHASLKASKAKLDQQMKEKQETATTDATTDSGCGIDVSVEHETANEAAANAIAELDAWLTEAIENEPVQLPQLGTQMKIHMDHERFEL
ncbi:hypothetical protein BD410DRAFT_785255 [Rickenella mellea]|uniref:Peptidase C14 caspase domain-containing protein n=1 Tax=Rickenella mellea TaxID=50990 RepID=A0A4Y7QCL9_9AGAM|nr:hypothetical protein BD410DRAFT_785255 [Rickenella mellea]